MNNEKSTPYEFSFDEKKLCYELFTLRNNKIRMTETAILTYIIHLKNDYTQLKYLFFHHHLPALHS